MASDEVLYATVTDTVDIETINIDDDYGQPTKTAIVVARRTILELGDYIEIDLGYETDHSVEFKGYVLAITQKRTSEGWNVSIRARDQMWRAMALFIASSDPQAPLKYKNIDAEDLVAAMLELAGITSYSLDSPGFTFAPEKDLEVNLMSSWDMISKVTRLLAWHCYDDAGTVKFNDRKPYNVAGDSSVYSFTTGDSGEIESVGSFTMSSEKIRNKVVVYGHEGVHAEASASSPFLPSGFYKAEVISAPNLIDTTAQAQDIADYNLDLLNRLEKNLTITVVGVPGLKCRQVVTVTESETEVFGDWLIYNMQYAMTDKFLQTMTLVQRQTS